MEMNEQPEVSTTETVGEKKRVNALVLAEALLDYALKPAGPELERKCSPHYLDELLFFKMFTVDYILGLKSVSNPVFAAVRQHYNEEIETGCVGDDRLHDFHDTVVARFETYSEACNADNLTPREYKGKRLVFWELGKAFSSLASDTQPWRRNALEVVLHANIFVSDLKRLAEFLEQYEVVST
jgi:hypothetical protein